MGRSKIGLIIKAVRLPGWSHFNVPLYICTFMICMQCMSYLLKLKVLFARPAAPDSTPGPLIGQRGLAEAPGLSIRSFIIAVLHVLLRTKNYRPDHDTMFHCLVHYLDNHGIHVNNLLKTMLIFFP